jgi:hypothetical protein
VEHGVSDYLLSDRSDHRNWEKYWEVGVTALCRTTQTKTNLKIGAVFQQNLTFEEIPPPDQKLTEGNTKLGFFYDPTPKKLARRSFLFVSRDRALAVPQRRIAPMRADLFRLARPMIYPLYAPFAMVVQPSVISSQRHLHGGQPQISKSGLNPGTIRRCRHESKSG